MQLNFKIDIYFRDKEPFGIKQPSIFVSEEIAEDLSFAEEITRIAKKYSIEDFHIWHLCNEKELFYADYFSEEILSHLCCSLQFDPSPLNVPSGKLVNIFSLQNKQIWIVINGQGIGYTVGRHAGLVFTIHPKESNKHHGKHVHCFYSGEDIEIDIVNVCLLTGGFKNKKKTRLALDIIKLNRDGFISSWDNAVENNIILPFKLMIP